MSHSGYGGAGSYVPYSGSARYTSQQQPLGSYHSTTAAAPGYASHYSRARYASAPHRRSALHYGGALSSPDVTQYEASSHWAYEPDASESSSLLPYTGSRSAASLSHGAGAATASYYERGLRASCLSSPASSHLSVYAPAYGSAYSSRSGSATSLHNSAHSLHYGVSGTAWFAAARQFEV